MEAAPPMFFPLHGNEAMGDRLAEAVGGDAGLVYMRRFPDGETYLRLDTSPSNRPAVVVATLNEPDAKVIPVAFLAETARELGATAVGLVAPYLAYLRQDRRFQAGEGLTSKYFARLLSRLVDWVVTVDPHLHRLPSLGAVYAIPALAVHAAPALGRWIADHVIDAIVIGPDVESAQWVKDVAAVAGVPSVVLQKTRRGDADVSVSLPDLSAWRERTPVLVDDIISTARTMVQAAGHLRAQGLRAPVCAAVHAVFAADAMQALRAAGVERIVTCNSIPHTTNAIDVSPEIAAAVREMIA